AVGAIMAAAITGTNTWSGLPVGVGSLGTALASWPLSRLMARFGRRPGLALGYSLAVVGAALGILGVGQQSFALFLTGMALFGTAQTSNLLARYAAADISPGAQRGRAMGLIVWGSAVGSIVGPILMAPAIRVGAVLGVSSVASAFLISVAGYALAAMLVQAVRPLRAAADDRRRRRRAAAGAGPRRPRARARERARHRRTLPERRRLEPRLRLRERAAHRRALAGRAGGDPGTGRPRHGPDGRRRQRARRHGPRRVGLRHPQYPRRRDAGRAGRRELAAGW